uniref:Ig-like domain-containing protein n=1 Tax=Pygocentrus nattereri TaxID=42514 RepID=A0A3B4E270_PYGNA
MLPALCSLFTALSCVSGVTVVTQKPPVLTPTKGEKTTMHCNLGTVTNYAAHWYKQVPGEAPKHVIRNRHSWSSPYYGSGFSSPKFISTCSSYSDCSVIISNVEVGDSAVYYCITWDSSASEWRFFCCDIFRVGPAAVRWLVDGKADSSGVTTGSAEQQSNKKFRLSSYLTIERSEWDKDKAITCEVSAASKASTKEIQKGESIL